MLLHLTLTASLVLASSAPLPQTMKDDPPPRFAASRRLPAAMPPMPERNLSYVLIENGGDARLPMSREELERYGLSSGQIIPLYAARRIVEEKLKRAGH